MNRFPTYIYTQYVYILNMARPSKSGFTRNALETHRAGADRPAAPSASRGPRPGYRVGIRPRARGRPSLGRRDRDYTAALHISLTTAAPTTSGARVSERRVAPHDRHPGPSSAASQRSRPPTWPAPARGARARLPAVGPPGRAPGPRSCSAAAEPNRGLRPGSQALVLRLRPPTRRPHHSPHPARPLQLWKPKPRRPTLALPWPRMRPAGPAPRPARNPAPGLPRDPPSPRLCHLRGFWVLRTCRDQSVSFRCEPLTRPQGGRFLEEPHPGLAPLFARRMSAPSKMQVPSTPERS